MSLAAILLEARLRAGLSQRQLAQRAGTSQSAVARIEAGAVNPSLETAQRLVAACGCRLEFTLASAVAADPVTEAYKRDVDRTLLRENLGKSVEKRLRDIDRFRQAAAELRGAVRQRNTVRARPKRRGP